MKVTILFHLFYEQTLTRHSRVWRSAVLLTNVSCLQVPGELHGGRPGRRHAGLPPLRSQGHHSPEEGADAHESHMQVSFD